MAYIVEQFKTEISEDIKIEVLQKDTETHWTPYAILNVEFDVMRNYTPKELITIGRMFIDAAKSARKKYTANGNLRKVKNKQPNI